MRALVLGGPGEIHLEEVAEPVLADGEVLIAVDAAGVCGTDRHIVAGDLGVPPGTIPGHEIAGRILETTSTVDGWNSGDRVAAIGQVTCGTCLACLAGCPNRCRQPEILGMSRQGGFAERIALPASSLIALPDDVTCGVGAIASDAIATPFHALTTVANLQVGETVVIIGAGGLGVHAVQLARLCGADRVVAVDPSPAALDAAMAAGADDAFDPGSADEPARVLRRMARGATLVLECVGRSETVELGMAVLSPGGRLVVVGIGSTQPKLPSLGLFIGAELSVHGSFGSTPAEIQTVLDLISSGRLDVSRSVQRKVPLADAAKVFSEPFGPARTVITPEERAS